MQVCAIRAARDELLIEQAFTFPMHPRALDTGVSDRTKGGEATAGGFGDGFKTAAISLLAQPGLRAAVEWHFEAEGRHVLWQFLGAHRAAVGTYKASEVLEVHVTASDLVTPHRGARDAGAAAAAAPEHRMVQVVRAKGVGDAFLQEAMPRLQVFWQAGAKRRPEPRASAVDGRAPLPLPRLGRRRRPPVDGSQSPPLACVSVRRSSTRPACSARAPPRARTC